MTDWKRSSEVVCHGWLTKEKALQEGWWERYFVLRSDGLLGWYTQPPADIAAPAHPRNYVYIAQASVAKQRRPPAFLNHTPEYVVAVQEAGGNTPSVVFGADDELAVDAWHRELLAAGCTQMALGVKVPWGERRGGAFSEGGDVARSVLWVGECLSSATRTASGAVERTLSWAGQGVATKGAHLLCLPDSAAAGTVGARVGHLTAAPLSLVSQAPGVALAIAGRMAGGARRPRYCHTCAGRSRELLNLEESHMLGQFLACDGCGGVPVTDHGCLYCQLRFCAECFDAHTRPPQVHPPREVRVANRTAEEENAITEEIISQRARDRDEQMQRWSAARESLRLFKMPQRSLVAPPDWCGMRGNVPPKGWAVTLVRDPALLRGLQACLATEGDWLGRGRDVVRGETYERLHLTAAWEVEHHLLWPKYCKAAEEVEAHSRFVPMLPAIMRNEVSTHATSGGSTDELRDWGVAIGCPLQDCINEKLLAHGTKPETVASLLASGINERFCSGLFGNGCYLAEDCGKCDQYATVDEGIGAHRELHELLYTNHGLQHPGPVHYILLCRVVLGTVSYTLDGETDRASGTSVWASREKRELAPIANSTPPLPHHSLIADTGARLMRYREVMVFHSERVYPAYLIGYRRV